MKKCNHCDTKIGDGLHRQTGGYCQACELVTIPEAVDLLQVSRPTYYRLARAGRIHPRNISPGRVLIFRAEIEQIRTGGVK